VPRSPSRIIWYRPNHWEGKGPITSKIKHAIKQSAARLAQLLQPSLAFCFSLQPLGCKLIQNANEGCNSCASLAGLVLSFIACFILRDRSLTTVCGRGVAYHAHNWAVSAAHCRVKAMKTEMSTDPSIRVTELWESDVDYRYLYLLGTAADNGDVCEFIGGRLHAVNSDPSAPPYDSVREYAYEGAGSIAGSLSSLASGDESDAGDWDELSNWGPRFNKLADVCAETWPQNTTSWNSPFLLCIFGSRDVPNYALMKTWQQWGSNIDCSALCVIHVYCTCIQGRCP